MELMRSGYPIAEALCAGAQQYANARGIEAYILQEAYGEKGLPKPLDGLMIALAFDGYDIVLKYTARVRGALTPSILEAQVRFTGDASGLCYPIYQVMDRAAPEMFENFTFSHIASGEMMDEALAMLWDALEPRLPKITQIARDCEYEKLYDQFKALLEISYLKEHPALTGISYDAAEGKMQQITLVFEREISKKELRKIARGLTVSPEGSHCLYFDYYTLVTESYTTKGYQEYLMGRWADSAHDLTAEDPKELYLQRLAEHTAVLSREGAPLQKRLPAQLEENILQHDAAYSIYKGRSALAIGVGVVGFSILWIAVFFALYALIQAVMLDGAVMVIGGNIASMILPGILMGALCAYQGRFFLMRKLAPEQYRVEQSMRAIETESQKKRNFTPLILVLAILGVVFTFYMAGNHFRFDNGVMRTPQSLNHLTGQALSYSEVLGVVGADGQYILITEDDTRYNLSQYADNGHLEREVLPFLASKGVIIIP